MFIQYSKYRVIYFVISAVLIVASLFAIFKFGLKPGIDFTGGSVLEVSYSVQRPANDEIRNILTGMDLGSYSIQPTGDAGVILRTKYISEDIHSEILKKLGKDDGKIEEIKFDSIGPSIGNELKQKTKAVAFFSLLAIVVYIAIAFNKVQRPLRSWQYGVASLISLFHDIIIPLGVFAALGKYYGTEITIPVITALLTFLGHSINNTVVVFDRIRENIFRSPSGFFSNIVDKSLNQTLSRQLNTSLTTLFGVVAIYLFGGATLRDFSLALILGIICATYSSFFISGPVLVSWISRKEKRAIDKKSSK